MAFLCASEWCFPFLLYLGFEVQKRQHRTLFFIIQISPTWSLLFSSGKRTERKKPPSAHTENKYQAKMLEMRHEPNHRSSVCAQFVKMKNTTILSRRMKRVLKLSIRRELCIANCNAHNAYSSCLSCWNNNPSPSRWKTVKRRMEWMKKVFKLWFSVECQFFSNMMEQMYAKWFKHYTRIWISHRSHRVCVCFIFASRVVTT